MNDSAANSDPSLIHEWTEGSSLTPSSTIIVITSTQSRNLEIANYVNKQ